MSQCERVVAPTKETLLISGFVGKRGIMGFSMLIPFWERTITVLPGVTAGAIMSATVGETSGMFFVVTRMKSNGGRFSFTTSGTALQTLMIR